MDALEKEYFDEMKENQEEIKELLFRIADKLEVSTEDEEDISEIQTESDDDDE